VRRGGVLIFWKDIIKRALMKTKESQRSNLLASSIIVLFLSPNDCCRCSDDDEKEDAAFEAFGGD
jgi:hypothetical protein